MYNYKVSNIVQIQGFHETELQIQEYHGSRVKYKISMATEPQIQKYEESKDKYKISMVTRPQIQAYLRNRGSNTRFPWKRKLKIKKIAFVFGAILKGSFRPCLLPANL